MNLFRLEILDSGKEIFSLIKENDFPCYSSLRSPDAPVTSFNGREMLVKLYLFLTLNLFSNQLELRSTSSLQYGGLASQNEIHARKSNENKPRGDSSFKFNSKSLKDSLRNVDS